MAEYIEREAAISVLRHLLTPNKSPAQRELIRIAAIGIRQIRAADVAPVRHGRWVYPLGMAWNYVCSECGKSIGVIQHNYCPNCGAKMDLEGGSADVV